MKSLKKMLTLLTVLAMCTGMLAACGSSNTADETTTTAAEETTTTAAETTTTAAETTTEAAETATGDTSPVADDLEDATVYLYAAASMENAFEDAIIPAWNELFPNVEIVGSYDSSGTLQSQIEEANGNGIDIFFSAATKNVTALEDEGLVTDGTRVDLLGNALCLVTYKDSGTAVTGWENMNEASSMALCDGTVPVGKYTRKLLVAFGLLAETDTPEDYTTEDVAAALGGIEINECANVSAATAAVAEQSNEIGTCYYTDYYSVQDDLEIIVMDEAGEYTGAITYPVCQITNAEASEAEIAATEAFLAYLQTDEALDIFADYCFVIK